MECHIYGRPGDRQKGIDLVATLADGTRWAVQCRQWKKFTAANTKAMIKHATYEAQRFTLLLSCEAGVEVRNVIDATPTWDCWDVDDVSRRVRDLPLDVGRRLVETHFGATWRSVFLGVSGLMSFLRPQQYFADLMDTARLFHHGWSLVGRDQWLQRLRHFANSPKRVGYLTGPGGVGKTKLLQHSTAVQEETDALFLVEGVPITRAALDDLPGGSCLIVVDDAHRVEGLATLLAWARQHPKAKVLLSARPQGRDQIASILVRAGYDQMEVAALGELEVLPREDVRALAKQALGADRGRLTDALTSATLDCPLVTVVAGRLLADNAIAPSLIERHIEFRNEVLARFSDELFGHIGAPVDPLLCRHLLAVVAAVAPFRTDDQRYVAAATESLGSDEVEVRRTLGILEQRGILNRRGETLRVRPDVLGDHILYNACIDATGRPTGYATQVFKAFGHLAPAHVLRNLGELDWRIRVSGDNPGALLDEVWADVRQAVRDGSNVERRVTLDLVSEVAYYQPRRVLELVEFVLSNPATKPDTNRFGYTLSHADVVRHLPPLLRAISYTPEFLRRCCDLLWQLGRDDTRRQNQHGDHPMRVLADLAGYGYGKPIFVNFTVLDTARSWLEVPDAHTHANSPLDVVDALFAKSGYTVWAEGHQLVSRTFAISRDVTAPLRQSALQLVRDCLCHPDRRVVLRALKSLEQALREPVEFFGRQVTGEERAQWVRDQLEVIDSLDEVARRSLDRLVQLGVQEILGWHSLHSSSEEVKTKAQQVRATIQESFDMKLTRALSRHVYSLHPDEGGRTSTGAARRTQRETAIAQVVREFLARCPDPSDGVSTLSACLQGIEAADELPHPPEFLVQLGNVSPEYAQAICEQVAEGHGLPLRRWLAPLLSSVRRVSPDLARRVAEQALAIGDVSLCQAIGQSYVQCSNDLNDLDIPILERLLTHPDVYARWSGLWALKFVGQANPSFGIRLLLRADISGDPSLVETMCDALEPEFGISFDALSEDDWSSLLAKLEGATVLDGHHVCVTIREGSRRVPLKTVEMLLRRIERVGDEASRDYHPMPYTGFTGGLPGVADSAEYGNVLRLIRNRMLRSTPRQHFWLSLLFANAWQSMDGVGREVLVEWLEGGDPGRIDLVATLLGEVPSEFVFSNVPFVEAALERAIASSSGSFENVASALEASAFGGTSVSTPGEPPPRDVSIRDRARAIAGTLVNGSPAHRFYIGIAAHAEASIRRVLVWAEETE